MPIQYRLDYVINKSSGKSSDERALIRAVAGIKLTPSDATRVWPRILDHKWYLSERLGRDVGPRVAIIDYLENVEPLRRRVNGFKSYLLSIQERLLAEAAKEESSLAAF